MVSNSDTALAAGTDGACGGWRGWGWGWGGLRQASLWVYKPATGPGGDTRHLISFGGEQGIINHGLAEESSTQTEKRGQERTRKERENKRGGDRIGDVTRKEMQEKRGYEERRRNGERGQQVTAHLRKDVWKTEDAC